ncbi:MAG: hypothetical protein GWN29_02595, partial [Gammaproteobacteria bacterium]|nr:hypothetical protein [Gammaproteobacteria bacterium]
IELDRNVLTRLTVEPRENRDANWTRDGQVLAFGSIREGTRNIYVKRDGGTGPTELLLRLEGDFGLPVDW